MSGISPNTVKARIRAEMTWQQLIRGKYNSSLQVGDSDIAKRTEGPQLKAKPQRSVTRTRFIR